MEPRDVLQHCPLCHGSYQPEAVSELEGPQGRKLFHCYCQGCKRAMLAVMFEASGWLSSVGILTELTAEESRRCPDLSPIDADICVKAHQVFEEESRGFCLFLQKQAKKPSYFRS